MLSKPLLKATIKQNYIVFLIILAVLMLYLPTIISLYDPKSQESLNDMLQMLPKQMVSAMGFSTLGSTLIEFIASYYYGFLILLLPMIYTVIVANRSLASHVDKGSMAYLLSTPNTRRKIAWTQAFYLLVSITLLLGAVTLVGIGISQVLFPGELDISGFLKLNLGVLFLYFAVTGIGFLASSIFNESKNSLAVGAGLPVAFLVLQMISNVSDNTNFFKYFTLFTLFNPTKITTGGNYILSFILLAAIGAVMYSASVIVFSKRDLPL